MGYSLHFSVTDQSWMDSTVLPAGIAVTSDLWGRWDKHFPHCLQKLSLLLWPTRHACSTLGLGSSGSCKEFCLLRHHQGLGLGSISADRSSVTLGLTRVLASGQHRTVSTLMGAGFPKDAGDAGRKREEKCGEAFCVPLTWGAGVGIHLHMTREGLDMENCVFSQFRVWCRQHVACAVQFSQHCLLWGLSFPLGVSLAPLS